MRAALRYDRVGRAAAACALTLTALTGRASIKDTRKNRVRERREGRRSGSLSAPEDFVSLGKEDGARLTHSHRTFANKKATKKPEIKASKTEK